MLLLLALLALPGAGQAANDTIAGTASAAVGGCSQITVTAPFTGDDDGDGSALVEYNTLSSWPGTTACAAAAGPSPRVCLATGLAESTAYFVRVTYSDPDGVSGNPVQVLPGVTTTTACAGNSAPPMVLFVSPARNAIVGATERFKVQVYDPDGVLPANVLWALDGAAPGNPVTEVTSFDCNLSGQTGCTLFTFDVDTTALTNGGHYVTVKATDSASPASSAYNSWAFRVNNLGSAAAGTGNLLRRTQSSQLCSDCHNLATHSSQATSAGYGSWAQDCLACHTPHQTANIYLIRQLIETPASGEKAIDFRNRDGKADFSYATVTAPGQGICEACHTKTENSDATPRFRNTGESDGGKHYSSQCTGCHTHALGFAAGESEGGATCAGCHPDIWEGMNGAAAKTSRHAIGNVLGLNDAFTDSGLTWGSPLSANGLAARSCLNMCHNDHPHTLTSPVQPLHENNVYRDATSAASRAAGSKTSADKDRTDFEAGDANGGLCVSCHRHPAAAGRPLIDRAAYDASAHDYTANAFGTWTYTLHDSGVFDRNCTKCHAGGDAAPGASAIPFGAVHFSEYPALLSGSVNPGGAPASFQCYGCHGDGATGSDFSGKDLVAQIGKTYNHPTDADAVHDSVAEESGAAFGNQLGGAARHVNCLDCHDPHQAQAGTHATPGNKAGPPLEGAWGAELSNPPSFWASPTAGSFTQKTIQAGVDAEATLCFKCHSSYYGTLPASPSGGYTQTDAAREFNPNNTGSGSQLGGFHPVLASAGNNRGATSNIKAPWTRTSLMTCSDCHESDSAADPNGPHGSTAGFLLKGPNTLWNETLQARDADQSNPGMPFGTFCINCHYQDFRNSRFQPGGKGHFEKKHSSEHNTKCFNCHSAIPHGTARPGLLVTPRSQSIGGLQVTDASPYLRLPPGNAGLQINSYPNNNIASWSKSNCACGDDNWGH